MLLPPFQGLKGLRVPCSWGSRLRLHAAASFGAELGLWVQLFYDEPLWPETRHPRALGLQITVYDPNLDADGACASRLVALLERMLVQS